MTMTRQYQYQFQMKAETPTPDDVLTALSAFPTPPNHIPASPAASVATTSSYFSLPREREREGDAPPSSFNRSKTKGAAGPRRRGSAASGVSVASTQSAQSGKLSVLVNGRDLEYGHEGEGKRDSGSGSSAKSGVSVNGSGTGGAMPSPLSGRFYYTAPNSPLPPGTPSAGPSSEDAPSSSSSLNTPASAYPHSTSPASAYPSSSPSGSAYPHSPAYSYSNTSRYAYPSPYTSPYTPSSTSPASMNPNLSANGAFNAASAYAPSSARAALSMLSTPVSASSSSSPSSAHVPISAVGMSPIEEKDERPRPRRQSSVPPANRRHQQQNRQKLDSESGSEIGGPPSVPLPPLPSTAKTNSSFGQSTPTPTPGPTSSMTPRAPASVKSLPSLRSGRSGKSTHDHGRKESGVSVLSTVSGTSAFSAVAPSLAEFGVAKRSRVDAEIELGGEASTEKVGNEMIDERETEGPKSRARTLRAGAVSLRIDIPPSYAQQKEHTTRQQQIEKPALGSANSLTSPFPRELGERNLRERTAEGEKMNSPTASVFSVASGMTTRSGMSTAQILRTRVSGMLDGLGNVPGLGPSTSPSASTRTIPSPNGGGREVERRSQNMCLRPATSSASMSSSASASVISGGSSVGSSNGLLTAEDLHTDPLLARAVTPVTPLENARGAPSPSPLELSDMGRALRAMRAGPGSPLNMPSLAHVPPLSDMDTDGNESDRMGADAKLSPGLLGQFPSTPTTSRPSPSSYPFPDSSSHLSPLRTPTLASSPNTNGISRTISQSRRKPLPPAPRGLHASLSSVSSHSSFESARSRNSSSNADGAVTAFRGRTQGARGIDEDGATSPDIATMMCATPRPVSRSKSASARSNRSTKSPSTRSSSVRSAIRDRARPSLPDERSRQKALARASAVSSSSSASPSRMSSITRKGLSKRRSAGSEFADAYAGIEDDANGDASMDYGVAIARHRGGYDLSPSLLHVDEGLEDDVDEFGALRIGADGKSFYAEEAEAMLGADANGSPDREEESDSDIDLHTPLPHILLREGVLSPRSKVLSSASSTGSLSVRSSFLGSGRDSVVSNSTNVSFGSVMTKSGLFKDERNTEGRRRRHRDGKNLRGGLGLTTGLGWSDSEDEDAPSPFTNRLSTAALSRNSSMASFHSSSSKQSQFFSRSTPSSASNSRTSSTYSGRLNLTSARSSRGPMRQSEPHPLSKSYSTASLARPSVGPYAKRTPMKGVSNENRSMSPTPTSSSSTSLPFPPTPRDDVYDDSEGSLLSGSIGRSRADSRASSIRAKTPTVNSVKARQSTSQLHTRVMSSSKSTSPSRLPSTGMATPRPLRLPALQQQQRASHAELQEDDKKLQPGQPTPHSGALLGYNRNLHDRQRAQQRLAAPMSAPSHTSPPSPLSPAVSPALSAQSAPSSSTAYGNRLPYGSVPLTSALRPSAAAASRMREPSPSRLSASTAGLGRPRTGTGMVYRQSSLPPSRVGSVVGRPTAI